MNQAVLLAIDMLSDFFIYRASSLPAFQEFV
jgi:hypothetical protein